MDLNPPVLLRDRTGQDYELLSNLKKHLQFPPCPAQSRSHTRDYGEETRQQKQLEKEVHSACKTKLQKISQRLVIQVFFKGTLE
jgi:hypothetical protein